MNSDRSLGCADVEQRFVDEEVTSNSGGAPIVLLRRAGSIAGTMIAQTGTG